MTWAATAETELVVKQALTQSDAKYKTSSVFGSSKVIAISETTCMSSHGTVSLNDHECKESSAKYSI